jgi:hypothetical protein
VYESSKRRVWYPDYEAQALLFGTNLTNAVAHSVSPDG